MGFGMRSFLWRVSRRRGDAEGEAETGAERQ